MISDLLFGLAILSADWGVVSSINVDTIYENICIKMFFNMF